MADSHDHDKHKHDEPGRSLAAVFQSRAEARGAIGALHKAKFTHTWLGTTSIAETSGGEPTVTVESGGFFSGTDSLVDALVTHGVLGETARDLEERIEPGNAVVTVDPKDRAVDEALRIITEYGGRTAEASSATDWGAWPDSAETFTDMNGDVEYEESLFYRR